jgi:hypothetical protein
MLNLFTSLAGTELTLGTYLLCIGAALLCGVIAAAAALFRSSPSKSFLISLLLLPPIVATVIAMVNGSVGTGIAVAGAFSLVRFRSVPGRARDIVLIFLAMTAGLTCAAGYPLLALLFTALVAIVLVIAAGIPMAEERQLDLRITVPETLHFQGSFDEVFDQYTRSHKLLRVKTTNMGSLYKLHYKVELKDGGAMQQFIDALRCRNGNLEIALGEGTNGGDTL